MRGVASGAGGGSGAERPHAAGSKATTAIATAITTAGRAARTDGVTVEPPSGATR